MATGGRAETGYKKALQKNHTALRKTLKATDDFVSDLYGEEVLTGEEYDKLLEIPATEEARVRDELLKVMRGKLDDDAKKFVQVLEKGDQKDLAQAIKKTASEPALQPAPTLQMPQATQGAQHGQGAEGSDPRLASAAASVASLNKEEVYSRSSQRQSSQRPGVEIISSLPKEYQIQYSTKLPGGPARTILVLGKTGHGKSSLGNNILGSDEFESDGAPSGVTVKVKKVTKEVRGRTITSVDTPGTMDPKRAMEVLDEIGGAIANCEEGYDAFIIVLRYPLRFTDEEEKAIEKFKLIFGDQVGSYGMLVFTGGDTYRKEKRKKKQEVNFKNYVDSVRASEADPIRPLFEFYKNRWLLVDNFEEDDNEMHRQINQLVKMVDDISQSNGRKYDMDLFEVARQAVIEAKRENPNIGDEELFLLKKERVMFEAEKKAGGGCFPGNSVVIRLPEEQVAISEINEGEHVLVMLSNGTLGYDTFYMQGHNDADTIMKTVTLTTSTGQQLTASDDHFIYVSDNTTTKRMCDVTVGDYVLVVNPHDDKSHGYHITCECVTKKEHTTSRGMYNPMTLSGTIVVDNIVATNYERPLHPAMAHMLLAPVRGLYRVAPWLVRAVNRLTYRGVPAWAYGLMVAITWVTDMKGWAKGELL